ncbi:MAG: cytochrome c [Bacteroidetes bacterium]|nr:cytochrome c [Bacteroidota bacterium]
MKKILKITGVVLVSFIAIVGLYLVYIAFTDIPSYDIVKIEFQSKSTPESIERGEKLTLMLCANCHLNNDTRKLTGKRMLDAPTEFGEIYSQNITKDKQFGIGNWTDAELLYLLRTGIKKNGQYSPPYMAKVPNMADEDVNAIITFLRSKNPMVEADPTTDTPSKPTFFTKFLCRVAFLPFEMPSKQIPMPDTSNALELGKYLAHSLDCFSCHSADFKTNDFLDPPKSEGYFGGGNKLLDELGREKLALNITPDKVTGIGKWTKEEFVTALKYGIIKDGVALQYPMMTYSPLTDYEAGAIYDYLRTIPPIKNKVNRKVY